MRFVTASTCHPRKLFEDDERLALISGEIRFLDSDLALAARERGEAFALAEGFRAKRRSILERVRGNFALAISERRGAGLLAVDRMGTRPIYYLAQAGSLRFGSTLDAFALMPDARPTHSRQAIYEYLYFHMVPGPETIYEGWKRLLPGTFMAWDEKRAHVGTYWEMQFEEELNLPFGELKNRFVQLLGQSVGAASENGGKIGAFLSGGTDSSTVAGMLSRATVQKARTYSIGFAQRGYDEMGYARIAARHFSTDHHEYYVTPQDVVTAIPLVARAHAQPFGNASAIPSFYCARLAHEDGVQTMLAGDGGDELFGGNERYAKQYLYSLYSDLPDSLKKGLIDPIAFLFREDRPVLGKVRRYIKNASMPMPARYDNYNLVEHFGAHTIFTSDFLAGIDTTRPARCMAEVYWAQRARSMTNRMLGFDLKYTLADNDLPKVVQACEMAGVTARFPLLDDDVVEFAANLAPRLKVKGTRLRHFFKEALRDFLPTEIIQKTKHGFGLPFGHWLAKHEALRQIAFDSLVDLKHRNIVRPDFLDQLCARRLDRHAQYYGTMVWALMMLEQWFQRLGRTNAPHDEQLETAA